MIETVKAFIKDESGDVIQYAIVIAVLVGLFIWGRGKFAPALQETFTGTSGYLKEGINTPDN